LILRWLTLAVLSACLLQAQAPAPPALSLGGRILNPAGEPVKEARVRLRATPSNTTYTLETNEQGIFRFENLTAGTYRLDAQRAGFVPANYRDPATRAYDITVAPGQPAPSLELRLVPEAFIAGKVLNADGEAFPGARIQVFRWSYSIAPGRKQLQGVGSTVAGADGGYSVGGLPGGNYYVSAQDQRDNVIAQGIQARGNNEPEQRYLTSFYPGVTELDAALPVNLAAGANFRVADIRMRRSVVYRIFGKVLDGVTGAPAPAAIVQYYPADARLDLRGMIRTTPAIAPDGTFTITALPPGQHVIQVTSQRVSSFETVTITDRDANLTLRTAPGFEITGQVRWSEPSTVPLPQLAALRLVSWMAGAAPSARLADEGRFTIAGVGPATYEPAVSPMPPGAYIQSVQLDGQNVTGKRIGLSAASRLDIVLSPHAAQITGIARDAKGDPVPGVYVTAWTPGTLPADSPELPHVAQSGPDGRFSITGLAPGEYRLAAWEEIEILLFAYPPFYRLFDETAIRVKLTEESSEDAAPAWVPAASIAAAEARTY
jgi:hypothetical protein